MCLLGTSISHILKMDVAVVGNFRKLLLLWLFVGFDYPAYTALWGEEEEMGMFGGGVAGWVDILGVIMLQVRSCPVFGRSSY